MPLYNQIYSKRGKFSEPFIPTHPGGSHKMACCDCGLVHDMRFTAWMRVKGGYKKIPRSVAVVMIEARRNERATGQKRRNKKHKMVKKT